MHGAPLLSQQHAICDDPVRKLQQYIAACCRSAAREIGHRQHDEVLVYWAVACLDRVELDDYGVSVKGSIRQGQSTDKLEQQGIFRRGISPVAAGESQVNTYACSRRQ